jgi:hypothetical protein
MGLSVPRLSWVLDVAWGVLFRCFAFQRQYTPLGSILGYTISVTDALHLDYDHECAFWSQSVVLGKSAFR